MAETTRRRYSRGEIDGKVRKNIAAWLRFGMNKWARNSGRDTLSIREVAEVLGRNHAYLSRVLNESQTGGLELLIAMAEKFNLNAHDVLFSPPPDPRFSVVGSEQLSERQANERLSTALRKKDAEVERLRRRLRELDR